MLCFRVNFTLFFTLCSSLLIASGGCSTQKDKYISTELIKDHHFQHGFKVINPQHGSGTVDGNLNCDGSTKPAWNIAQWHSKYSISSAEPIIKDHGKVFKNQAKSITVSNPDTKNADLILAIDTTPEYQGRFRTANQGWPHLLVEQGISTCPSLAQMNQLHFHVEAKLLESDCSKGPGHDPALHTILAHFVIIVRNDNKNSKGYGDFFWFVVNLYDYRYPQGKVYMAQDTADPSCKFIYNPGPKPFDLNSMHNGHWITIDKDILPVVIAGINEAHKRGYLRDSNDLNDYSIASVNLGFEATGICKSALQIRNLSLKTKKL